MRHEEDNWGSVLVWALGIGIAGYVAYKYFNPILDPNAPTGIQAVIGQSVNASQPSTSTIVAGAGTPTQVVGTPVTTTVPPGMTFSYSGPVPIVPGIAHVV